MLHSHELELLMSKSTAWEHILACRLLYATLDPGQRPVYAMYLASMDQGVRASIKPQDVIQFVRVATGLSQPPEQSSAPQQAQQQQQQPQQQQQQQQEPEPSALIAWVLDELHVMDEGAAAASFAPAQARAEQPSIVSRFLSQFVELRLQCRKSSTLPLGVVTSTLWSSTRFKLAGSSHARVFDLCLWPLNDRQCATIFSQLCKRTTITARPAQLQAGAWPELWLQPSVLLPDPQLHEVPDPDLLETLLGLAGGNPRMLGLVVGCMAGTSPGGVFDAGGWRDFQSVWLQFEFPLCILLLHCRTNVLVTRCSVHAPSSSHAPCLPFVSGWPMCLLIKYVQAA